MRSSQQIFHLKKKKFQNSRISFNSRMLKWVLILCIQIIGSMRPINRNRNSLYNSKLRTLDLDWTKTSENGSEQKTSIIE